MWLPPPLPRTLEASLRDLRADKAEVRASAVTDLVRNVHRDASIRSRAITEIVRALEDDSAQVRLRAAEGLADLRAREATKELLLRIEDDDAYVRQMALTALGEIGDRSALGRLRRALRDPRPEVRFQAVVAFTRIEDSDEEVAGVLVEAMNDRDDEVRMIAVRAAEDRHAEHPLAQSVLDAAARLLDGRAHDVANAAAILLGKAGDARGDDRIARIVKGEIPASKEDEQGAIEACGERGIASVREALVRRAFGIARHFRDTCAFHAKIALARLGDARAIDSIRGDLGSSRRARREAAMVACGRAKLTRERARIEALHDVDEGLRQEALRALGKE